MQIIQKKTTDLIPYVNNPRNNEDGIDYVASSIKNFGFKVPIIIDSGNEIIAGHTRLLAAKKLGMETVPCIVADDLSPEQIKAFRLADNRVAEFSHWDYEILEIEIAQIEDYVDVEELGFLHEEVDEDLYNSIFEEVDEPVSRKSKIITCPHCGEEFEE